MAESVAASEHLKMEPADQPQPMRPRNPVQMKYKSWRKKYRKMRTRFDDSMEEANSLFLSTHHLSEVAQRLQEQNDQLLEILSDLNTSHKVPPQYRYDVQPLPSDPLQGDTPPSLYSRQAPKPGDIKLADLERSVTHTLYDDLTPLPPDLLDYEGTAPNGYLVLKHEEDYLGIIDNALDVIPLPTPSRPNTILDESVDLRPRHNSPPTERDFATQNPVSVHNWLLRNMPKIKDADGVSSEKGDAASTATGPVASNPKKKGPSSKKAPTKEDAPFEGLDDEIGFDAEEEKSKKSRKSKRDGDHTYRPKGGRSRAAKRKRGGEDGMEGETPQPKKAKGDADGED